MYQTIKRKTPFTVVVNAKKFGNICFSIDDYDYVENYDYVDKNYRKLTCGRILKNGTTVDLYFLIISCGVILRSNTDIVKYKNLSIVDKQMFHQLINDRKKSKKSTAKKTEKKRKRTSSDGSSSDSSRTKALFKTVSDQCSNGLTSRSIKSLVDNMLCALFHVPCRFLQYYGNRFDHLQKNKLARHSINYKEESWKGVSIGLGWKYHY